MYSFEKCKQSVNTLAGIGTQTASRLQKLGIETLQDLIFHLPLRYQDRSRSVPISQLKPGYTVLVCGIVDSIDSIQSRRSSIVCRIKDETGVLCLRFFHFSVQQINQFKIGSLVGCFGEIRYGYTGLEMVHPEYKFVQTVEQLLEPRMIPVYPLTDGLQQQAIRKAIQQALNICLATDDLFDILPAEITQQYAFPSLNEALQQIHYPIPQQNVEDFANNSSLAISRLALEELLAHHLALYLGKQNYKNWLAPIFKPAQDLKSRFIQSLPFSLTQAQIRVIAEIEKDFQSAKPMLRLIQGDVGSGKTIVAALACLMAVHSGFQVAVMAPTELLAEQHYRNFRNWLGENVKLDFFTGQIKSKARIEVMQSIKDGSTQIVIGTHALFQETVQFKNLGFIVIDEQHRFGVNQRLALREKGQTQGFRPHQLIMTATPIPRTLAMLQYSDLDISIIDELPPGRIPVVTRIIASERRQDVISRISNWIAEKRQVYWVCTLIEESDALQCEAAEKTANELALVLPEIRIGLIHGRLKSVEKDQIMQAFKQGECDLLVATTVIEVGVDVPNAGLMIIENPERLGLSQLHQLRGRVGRGSQESYCLLLYQSPLSEFAKQRLTILKQHNDGFVIAEKDLELRGPGDLMGTRQTGQMQFKIADLKRDVNLFERLPEMAQLFCQKHPELIQPLIKRWISLEAQIYQNIA